MKRAPASKFENPPAPSLVFYVSRMGQSMTYTCHYSYSTSSPVMQLLGCILYDLPPWLPLGNRVHVCCQCAWPRRARGGFVRCPGRGANAFKPLRAHRSCWLRCAVSAPKRKFATRALNWLHEMFDAGVGVVRDVRFRAGKERVQWAGR